MRRIEKERMVLCRPQADFPELDINDIELTANDTDTFRVLDGNACDDDPAPV